MPAPMMTTLAAAGSGSDSGMEDGFLAVRDVGLERLVHAAVDPRILIIAQQLLPFFVGHPVCGARSHPLPAIEVLRRGHQRTVEPSAVVAHRVFGAEVV